jgi:predicted Zn-dependent peptidase
MTTQTTTLANGLQVVSDRMGHLQTVSLGVWVNVGARHERDDQQGLAHLLEHMAFKGTPTRSAREIAEKIEGVGGDINAATGLDTTAYFARVLMGDEGMALEILADILLNSTFSAEELEKERDVILQEIAAAQDSPDDIVYDLMQAVSYPDQALGRPILGTPQSVSRFQPADIRSYLADHYHPGAMIVSAAGAIDHEKLVRHVEALFGRLTPGQSGMEVAARYQGGVSASDKPFEQSHVLIGLPSPSFRDPDFYAAQVFSGLFGGGMSSRLFQEIREDRGLCYSIYSSVWGLKDTGMFAVHAATSPQMVDELAKVVVAELVSVADKGPTDAELRRSKAQIKAGLLMALESSSARAEQMARQLFAHGRLMAMEELVDRVSDVSSDDVRNFAAKLATAAASIAVVGSGRKSRAQAERAAAAFAQVPFAANV